jgi:hypothetical protein
MLKNWNIKIAQENYIFPKQVEKKKKIIENFLIEFSRNFTRSASCSKNFSIRRRRLWKCRTRNFQRGFEFFFHSFHPSQPLSPLTEFDTARWFQSYCAYRLTVRNWRKFCRKFTLCFSAIYNDAGWRWSSHEDDYF